MAKKVLVWGIVHYVAVGDAVPPKQIGTKRRQRQLNSNRNSGMQIKIPR